MEFEKIKAIIAEVLNVDENEITMETTFTDDLGADSLDVFQIIMGLEEEFDIEIANEDAEKIVTVGDAVVRSPFFFRGLFVIYGKRRKNFVPESEKNGRVSTGDRISVSE